MRAFLAAAILLIFLGAAPQPEYSSYSSVPVSSDLDSVRTFVSLVEIESSRGDLEIHPSPATLDTGEQIAPEPASPQTSAAPSVAPAPTASPSPDNAEPVSTPSVPLDQLCNALLTSAQDNGLPVTFFANLIWQESRLRDDAVSRKGALGIAQFMPKVAAESGLQNPFDPLQALSASARFLRGLRDRFGNLGFVAAAYNAGAKRVSEWLARGRTLPRETRDYILHVTGSSAEQWQKAPPSDDALHFTRRLPCRDLPAFADLEEAQVQAELAQAPQVRPAPPQPDAKPPAKVAEDPAPAKRRERVAERKSAHRAGRRDATRVAERERKHDRGKREAREHRHAAHERHRRV